MNLIHALILGIVQGITEFFPVSSSSHLKIFKALLQLKQTADNPIFDLACHTGTLFALVIFLKDDILNLLKKRSQTLTLIVIAQIPLAPAYILLKGVRAYFYSTEFLGLFLIVTACILWFSHFFKISKEVSPQKSAFWIGCAQSLALLPGISRSGATLSCAKILGWAPLEAARFCFLISIPAIAGGSFLETAKLCFEKKEIAIPFSLCLVGLLASFTAGLFILPYAFNYLKKGDLKGCALYCLILGVATLIYFNT